MEIYKAESQPEESRVFSENVLETIKTEFHHQHQKSWVQILRQCYCIFYLDCSSLVKSFWHFNSERHSGWFKVSHWMSFKIIKSEGDPGIVVLSKEVGELSTLPVKISQVSSYQDDMDREPDRGVPWFPICIYYHYLTLSPFNVLLQDWLKYLLLGEGNRLLGLKSWNWKLLSRVRWLMTPWTIESMEFSRPEYRRG